MSFEIIIMEKLQIQKVKNNEWGIIGTEEQKREDSICSPGEPKTRLVNKMGYLPAIKQIVSEDHEIYRQTVDKLDLKSVISVINKIGG